MNLTDLNELTLYSTGSYREGIDAYWDGIMYEQNPYKENSVEHGNWASGWVNAEGNDFEDYRD